MATPDAVMALERYMDMVANSRVLFEDTLGPTSKEPYQTYHVNVHLLQSMTAEQFMEDFPLYYETIKSHMARYYESVAMESAAQDQQEQAENGTLARLEALEAKFAALMAADEQPAAADEPAASEEADNEEEAAGEDDEAEAEAEEGESED